MATPIASFAGIRAARPGMKFCGATKSTNVNIMRPQNGTERSSSQADSRRARSSGVGCASAMSSKAISCAMRASSGVDLVHVGRDDEIAILVGIVRASRLRRLDDVVELPGRDVVQPEARTIAEPRLQMRMHP